jgi:lambda family phage portal protein
MANEIDKEFSFARVRQEAFDGAVSNYRLEQRGLITGESDFLAARELNLLWQRSHHAVRNNGWGKTAKRSYIENLGAIKVKWNHKKMQSLWDEFAANPNLDGYGTLDNTQEGWNGAMFESGDSLTRMYIKRRDKFSIPLVIQTIEAEYLDPTYTANSPESTRNGITFLDGKPQLYHFSKKLNNFNINSLSLEKIIVPADEVLHIFIRDRPGQWRGIPSLASILLPLYELDDLTDATIAKQKAAQAIAWVIKNTNPTSALSVGSAFNSLDLNDIDSSTGQRRVITQASGGGTQYLNIGEDIAFYQSTDIGANLQPLINSELRKIAKGTGLTYEVLTGDLSGISLSALQWISIEMKIRAEFIYKFYIINLGLTPLCNRFKELAGIFVNKTLSTLTPTFEFPRRYGMNELKDAQADRLELDSDMTTLTRVLAERNLTMEEVFEDKKRRNELGLFIPPIKPTQINNVQANPNTKG